MSVVLQSGGSAIPADRVATSGSVSAYTARQFTILGQVRQGAHVSDAAQQSGAPEVTRLCAVG
jgi:hypothetical protein